MSYFDNFPFVDYKFGNDENSVKFHNLTAYVDIVDQIKDNVSFYEYYNIQDNERPDTLSYLLYNDIKYYWTFFLLNDHLKHYGWPESYQQIVAQARTELSNTTLVSVQENMASSGIQIGSTVTGYVSTATGTVIDVIPDYGQIVVEVTSGTFRRGGETVFLEYNNQIVDIPIISAQEQYNSVHHYEDPDGNYIDVDYRYLRSLGSEVIPVTYLDHYIAANDRQKSIKIIKPDAIEQVYSAFNDLIKD